MTGDVLLCSSGLFLPEHELTNAELVQSFNAYVDSVHSAGGTADGAYVDERAIVKASGVKSRRVVDKDGILDIRRMRPRLQQRPDSALSLQAELAVHAARQALEQAELRPGQLGLIVVGSTSLERAYPAVAIEVQHALGVPGYAFDLSAACSSATFALQVAAQAIACGNVGAALVISPELPTAQVNFRDPQTHFIFGDGAAAVVLCKQDGRPPNAAFRILGLDAETRFSNSIRNDFGFLNRCTEPGDDDARLFFRQNGVKAVRDVVPMASQHILRHLKKLSIAPKDVARLWLHQANAHLNRLVCERVLGEWADDAKAPSVLTDCGNLASAGSIAAFHRFHRDLPPGAIGVLCSFGAGYSVGSIVLQRLEQT